MFLLRDRALSVLFFICGWGFMYNLLFSESFFIIFSSSIQLLRYIFMSDFLSLGSMAKSGENISIMSLSFFLIHSIRVCPIFTAFFWDAGNFSLYFSMSYKYIYLVSLLSPKYVAAPIILYNVFFIGFGNRSCLYVPIPSSYIMIHVFFEKNFSCAKRNNGTNPMSLSMNKLEGFIFLHRSSASFLEATYLTPLK